MKRIRLTADVVTVLGNKWKETLPAWRGLNFALAEPRMQSTLSLAIVGSSAPIDVHLNVPFCHPDDQTGGAEDWTDCVYRVRPRMQVGKKWKGEEIDFVAFERWNGEWFIVFSTKPPRRRQRATRENAQSAVKPAAPS